MLGKFCSSLAHCRGRTTSSEVLSKACIKTFATHRKCSFASFIRDYLELFNDLSRRSTEHLTLLLKHFDLWRVLALPRCMKDQGLWKLSFFAAIFKILRSFLFKNTHLITQIALPLIMTGRLIPRRIGIYHAIVEVLLLYEHGL